MYADSFAPADNGQPEESRIARETDRVRQSHQALRHIVEPRESELLLPVREGREPG